MIVKGLKFGLGIILANILLSVIGIGLFFLLAK